MPHQQGTDQFWGLHQGNEVYLYQLSNDRGSRIAITNFGATLVTLEVADRSGRLDDVVLGYDDLQGYVDDAHYMGAIVGRYANRVAGKSVNINGAMHQLTTKPEGYHHHGGKVGFNKKVWLMKHRTANAVTMRYLSPDGEEGFPGNLLTDVTYTLTNENELIVDVTASTDKPTLINLTQHTYFNLAGHKSGDILAQQLIMPLDYYLPVNSLHVPDGSMASVVDTPFDFRQAKTIGEQIDEPHPLLIQGNGYDNTWVIKTEVSDELVLAAMATDPQSGRTLAVYTTEPSVHLYTGNFLNGVPGKDGAVYNHRNGFCLETQHYPDSPNHPHFPSTELHPGEVFTSRTVFAFGLDE